MNARVHRYTPPQQMLKVVSHSDCSSSTKLPPPPMPALLNSRLMCSVWWSLATDVAKAATADADDTSATAALMRVPAGASSSHMDLVASRPSADTSHIETWHPSALNWRASSRPIPEPPPVTTAIRPWRSFITPG